MKKLLLKITLGIFIASINLFIELYPIVKTYINHYGCNFNLDNYINEIKESDYLSFLDETEKEELDQLKEFRNQFCDKNLK